MCLFPINATFDYSVDKKTGMPVREAGRPKFSPEGELKLPCGKCSECISKRALEWATRARHEMSLHNENSFITLTYAPENLKSNFIIKEDFQKFVKRLRKKQKSKLKYMVSYEYGSQFFRPHMHAIFFGYNPSEQEFLKNSPSGNPLFVSPEIDELWEEGFHSIGTANEQTAYYIASYALKGKKRTITHPDTGEKIEIADQMDVSKRPAIGLNYLLKNAEQLVSSGQPLPRYYQKKLEEFNPDLFEEYQNLINLKLTNRSSGETYAKAIIDHQKNSMRSSHFREDLQPSEDTLSRKMLHQRLKLNRDDYVAYIKENKK